MAYLDDVRKRASGGKKVRIDHSDVYLENEKLADTLVGSLDRLARRRHRQIISHDNEIRHLRKTLNNMAVTKNPAATSLQSSASSSSSSFFPSSTTTNTTNTTTTTTFRRLKPPPTFMKLDVHVPHPNQDHASDKDDTEEDSDEEDTRRKCGKMPPSKTARLAWEDRNDRGDTGKASTRQDVKRIAREQLQLINLDMSAIPTSWFTQVHQPADVIPRPRPRPLSAHPSSQRPTSSSPSPTSTRTNINNNNNQPQRPQSEFSSRTRPRRTKSALPSTTTLSSPDLDEEDAYNNDRAINQFCGGPQQQKKTESTRSRRQLMEEMGVGKGRADSGGGGSDSNRLKFLSALRRERERLDGRVKTFLQSCDGVGEGGGISSRKAPELHTFLLPQTLASQIQI
ncbi:hypothetical protein ACOMHN_042888 [Nucella lapillus]